jgi:hypothetical protein
VNNAVETWCRIAFANNDEEPAKGRQGGLAMPRRAARHWLAVTALAVTFGAGRTTGARAIATVSKLKLPGFASVSAHPRIH